MCGHMARGVGEVLLLCVLSRNSRKTVLTMRLWPGKQGYHCACCQGTRLWHHFPSSRAASFWVDLYFTLPQRILFLREWYFTLTRRMETHSRYPPSLSRFFQISCLPFTVSLSHSLITSFLFSFMQGFMQGFMPALSPQAFAYFLDKTLGLCCLRCRRNLNDVRFF